MAETLTTDEKPYRAAGVLKQFHSDCIDFKHIEKLEDKTKKCQILLDRHLIHKTSVQQQIEMAKAKGWTVTAEHVATNERQMTHCLQTQLIEDIIATQKNNRGTMAQNRYKRPQAAMMSTLSSGVVDERHHFTSISADIPLPKRTKLEPNYFEADPEMQSLPFQEIANY